MSQWDFLDSYCSSSVNTGLWGRFKCQQMSMRFSSRCYNWRTSLKHSAIVTIVGYVNSNRILESFGWQTFHFRSKQVKTSEVAKGNGMQTAFSVTFWSVALIVFPCMFKLPEAVAAWPCPGFPILHFSGGVVLVWLIDRTIPYVSLIFGSHP